MSEEQKISLNKQYSKGIKDKTISANISFKEWVEKYYEKDDEIHQQYKSQKKHGLIASDISFKDWFNNIFKKDKEQKDINPDKPTDYSDTKMKLHIFGMNAFLFAGIVAASSVIFFTARHYYLKNKRAAAAA